MSVSPIVINQLQYLVISSDQNILRDDIQTNSQTLIVSSLNGKTVSSDIHKKILAIVKRESKFTLTNKDNSFYTLRYTYESGERKYGFALFVIGCLCCCLPLKNATLRTAYKSFMIGSFEVSYQVQE